MNIDYTVTALMFPAIPLIMTVYSNRFHTLSALIRKLHDEHVFEKHIPPEWEKQLINLNKRINYLKYAIGAASLIDTFSEAMGRFFVRKTFASNSLSKISFTIHPADLINIAPRKKSTRLDR